MLEFWNERAWGGILMFVTLMAVMWLVERFGHSPTSSAAKYDVPGTGTAMQDGGDGGCASS